MKPVLVAYIPQEFFKKELITDFIETLKVSTNSEYHIIATWSEVKEVSFKMYICEDATITNIENLQNILLNES